MGKLIGVLLAYVFVYFLSLLLCTLLFWGTFSLLDIYTIGGCTWQHLTAIGSVGLTLYMIIRTSTK